jgi:hypothetical protein
VDKVKLGRSGSDKAFDLNFSGPTSGAYYTSDGGHGGSGFGDMLDSLSFARFLSLLRLYHGDGRIHKYDTGPSLRQGKYPKEMARTIDKVGCKEKDVPTRVEPEASTGIFSHAMAISSAPKDKDSSLRQVCRC